MLYFGTDLRNAGHYLWELTGGFYRANIGSPSLPFDPYKHKINPKGHSEFENIGDYSVLYVTGSCKDNRAGTVSVFFLNGHYTKDQFIQELKSNPTAMSIIGQMPFEVDFAKQLLND